MCLLQVSYQPNNCRNNSFETLSLIFWNVWKTNRELSKFEFYKFWIENKLDISEIPKYWKYWISIQYFFYLAFMKCKHKQWLIYPLGSDQWKWLSCFAFLQQISTSCPVLWMLCCVETVQTRGELWFNVSSWWIFSVSVHGVSLIVFYCKINLKLE